MRIYVVLLSLLACGVARADTAEAKQHYEKATGYYALGKYSDAADEYEKAFALKPDPALLYNAAQAHRVAGNKVRALELYTNYVRIYGDQISNKTEVNRHIASLRKAIETDRETANAPPVSPQPIGKGGRTPVRQPEPVKPEPAPEPTPTPEPTPVVTPAPQTAPAAAVVAQPDEKKPITKKAWFWGVVGGGAAVVVLAVGLGVGLGVSSSPKDPTPTLGSFAGN
jgi:tetratricopeptide (TPR) repeat protein